MSEEPRTPKAPEGSPGARLVHLMWCGGYGMMWDAVKKRFAQMWGMGRPEDEERVGELLQAGAKALGIVLPGLYTRESNQLTQQELADHWDSSITAALAAGRFTPKELEAFFEEFDVTVEVGGELSKIHAEGTGLYTHWNALTFEINRIRQGNLVQGREIDRALRETHSERMGQRLDAANDETQRRLEASRAFGAARSEAKGAANRTSVAERKLAGGRGSEEEVEQAREEQRRAEQLQDEAKAALDRLDAEIKEARQQRREAADAPSQVRRENRLRAEEFEAWAKPQLSAIRTRHKELEAWHLELRKMVDLLESHYRGLWQKEQQRILNAAMEATQLRRDERDRAERERHDRERAAALGEPTPTPAESEAHEGVLRLRKRFAPEPEERRPQERTEAPPFGFTFPTGQDGADGSADQDGPRDEAEEAGKADAGAALTPPPIGFSLPE